MHILSLSARVEPIFASSTQTTSVILGDLFRADLTKGPPFTFDKITLPAVNFSATTKTLRGRQGHGMAMALNFIRFQQLYHYMFALFSFVFHLCFCFASCYLIAFIVGSVSLICLFVVHSNTCLLFFIFVFLLCFCFASCHLIVFHCW